ncbi:unnamed protein product [Phaeothamnion confervicola]
MSKKNANPVVTLTAGCIAGGIEATVVWPMEYIKTQLQLQASSLEVPKYTGVFSGIRYTVQTTGFLSLYRGLAPTLLGSMPKAGIRFGGNAYFKDLLKDKDGKLTSGKQFAAGAGAGAIEAVVAVAPIETVKTKCIQANMPFVKGLKHILATEGIRGVYQGVTATILKQASNQGLRFMWFNEYKRIMSKDGKETLNPIQNLLGGMSAGCFSTLGNNPFDVVKTKMQGVDGNKYGGTAGCAAHIWKSEGLKGFYRGLVPRLARVVPGQGVIFMSYEVIQEFVAGIVDKKK